MVFSLTKSSFFFHGSWSLKYLLASNKELIIKLYNYYNEYKIKFIHVKAHTSEPKDHLLYDIWYGNKMADKLATDASKKSSKEFYNLNGSNSKSKSFFPSAT